ncbi:MAG TPA: ribonuclease HI family protein, partial [Candidatus Krumholzibacteria bacterium]|nr:ribonuclease HI family protein [Candidatus Krumholzibacteria bacterium]
EAVLLALGLCRELGARHVMLCLDSELVVRQVDGSYKVKHPELQRLHARVHELMREFDSVEVEHVPREKNKSTDKLVNAALDGKELD